MTLPRDLSPWSMFLSADPLIQAVMLGLAFASVVTWLSSIAEQRSLADATRCFRSGRGVMEAFVQAAEVELKLSSGLTDKVGIKERVATRLARLESAAMRQMHTDTGLLATIGATAPFVGLFGTVWGIMNSFIGISKAQTTNLAVVAPGIAEALLATAMALFAAIPAVIIYNFFARWIGNYRGSMRRLLCYVSFLGISIAAMLRRLDNNGLAPTARLQPPKVSANSVGRPAPRTTDNRMVWIVRTSCRHQ